MSRRLKWVRHVEEGSSVCRILVGKPEGKRPLRRSRRGWEDNIKMDLQEVGCGDTNFIELTQNRDKWRALVNAVVNFRVSYNAGNFLSENWLVFQ
jgi:hypothetical protein